MNVTDMPNGSGFGVNDDLLRPGFGDTEPDSRVRFVQLNHRKDEYYQRHHIFNYDKIICIQSRPFLTIN